MGIHARAAGAAEPGADPGKPDPGKLELGGRVFLRETVASEADGPWQGTLALASARLSLSYHWKKVRAVVEVEAASGQARLRDGFLRLDLPAGLELRGGQFKIPLSVIENESTWSLPSIGRGVLSEVMQNSFRLTGRRPGLMLLWRGKGDSARPGVRAGVFQGQDPITGQETPGAPDEALGLDAAARASLAWKHADTELELGVGGSLRVKLQPAHGRYWAASVDAQFEHTWCGQGVRAWLEGFVGSNSSLLDTTLVTPGDPVFVAVRLLAAWRSGGLDKGGWYIEPYALASALDPNLDNASDAIWEVAGGVAGGRWRHWRVQLQAELWRKASGAPMVSLGGGVPLADHDAVLLQLGAAF